MTKEEFVLRVKAIMELGKLEDLDKLYFEVLGIETRSGGGERV